MEDAKREQMTEVAKRLISDFFMFNGETTFGEALLMLDDCEVNHDLISAEELADLFVKCKLKYPRLEESAEELANEVVERIEEIQDESQDAEEQ